ncbi:MAG TPA: hypothetical protein VFM54_13840 [Micromonosporaceae bacterium]|nr:hypothetical protein [Micromonosporaceae bacterium]
MVLPGRDAPEIEWLLFAQAGVLTWAQAAAELGRSRARHLVVSGRWRAVCRGVLIAHNGPLTAAQQLWVAVLAAGPGALLAGLTAAVEGGLRRFRPDPLRVLVPPGHAYPNLRHRLPADMPAVRVHRAHLPDAHVQPARPSRTTMPRSLVDAAAWARTDDEARQVVAAGCQQRLVLPDEILAAAASMPRLKRRRLVIETARDAAGGAEALSEIDFLRLCRRFGLPRPDLQERRRDTTGRIRFLDAYWRAWRLHAEVDGAHHMDVGNWEADMRRQNEVWLAGDRLLRFPAIQVRRRPAEVAAQLRAALTAAGWTTGPSRSRRVEQP